MVGYLSYFFDIENFTDRVMVCICMLDNYKNFKTNCLYYFLKNLDGTDYNACNSHNYVLYTIGKKFF